MHLESDSKVTIRSTVIGGPDLLVCMPLVAPDEKGLVEQARTTRQHKPDLLEWRVDAFDAGLDHDICQDALTALRDVVGELPLIVTCRSHEEGGLTSIPAAKRENLFMSAIQSGQADLIDMELSNDAAFIRNIQKAAQNAGLQLILSYHNFDSTPDQGAIIDTLFQAREAGADIAKVAVMPQEFGDVLTLMGAALKARKKGLKIPMIAISMGTLGSLTRLAGKLFGSDITFAGSETTSAPGQLPVQLLRQAMDALNVFSTK